MKEKLLKHKEELEKAFEQKIAELNQISGQKSYNELLLKELEEDGKEEEKENVLKPE
jgi:hypothetical protein